MSNTQYIPAPLSGATRSGHRRSTQSFGNHRGLDVPQSALHAGASARPRQFADPADRKARRADEPRTLFEIAFAPFEHLFGPGRRARIGAAVLAAMGAGALLLIY